MYVKIRNISAKPGDKDDMVDLSKKNLIREVKSLICDETGIAVHKQRLYYKGKQLHDDCSVMDYNIQLNDVIQIMELNSPLIPNTPSDENSHDDDSDKENRSSKPEQTNKSPAKSASDVLSEVVDNSPPESAESKYYRVGDAIDFLLEEYGAWFEGEICEILKAESMDPSDKNLEPDIVFKVKHVSDQGTTEEYHVMCFDEIKPRAYHNLNVPEIETGKIVLVNYNVENPTTRGYWYYFKVKRVNRKDLQGTILVGRDAAPLDKCTVRFLDEVLRIEEPVLLENRSDDRKELPPIRKTVYYCEKCKDVDAKPCRDCGCKVCAGKDEVDTILLCDECNLGYHIRCLTPPLSEVPSDPEWFCPDCRVDVDEIVKAGEKTKFSKKKTRMASAKAGATKRDWGRGMACAGRTKQCTIVPINHFGAIPGVEVGTCWLYRMQASEVGVHRSLVAGIHGRDSEGAFSLVLSGGYEDDVDYGNEFLYTGSGGRDLSNNKRVSVQSSDQKLTLNNKALARNCNTPISLSGGEATDWKNGKPVRVLRTWKFAKHSSYAPTVGCRYDGLYKVVKYYEETGKSGFKVWRYLLRRDDPAPAPWEPDAPQYPIVLPEGHLENMERKKRALEEKKKKQNKRPSKSRNRSKSQSTPSTSKGRGRSGRSGNRSSSSAEDSNESDGSPSATENRKRKNESSDDDSTPLSRKRSRNKPANIEEDLTSSSALLQQKVKIQSFVLPEELAALVDNDTLNQKEWEECKEHLEEGKPAFLEKVAEMFTCVCCQELIYLPITTECKHNVCKTCLKRSFKADIYSCPYCRHDLGADFEMVINDTLSIILLKLFPGYNAGR
uniref:RING-type E3 ubiquitin transferase n=1 Tax=Photinus pyralis TaxID=7054 RepID=A0A1Y1MRM4_PHOPY